MPYIGKLPTTGNFIKLDTISVVNGQAAYTLQKDSANFSPASANQMLVSLNGIIQNPGSSFTISGSTITFASNLVTGDVINYILVLGDVLNVGTVSDNTITNDKLATAPTLISKGAGSDSGAIQLNCEQNTHGVKIKGPPHSASQSYTLTLPSTAPAVDKMLQSDGSGNLSFVDAPSGGMTLLNSTTISSGTATVDFNSSLITSTYKVYVFHVIGLFDSVTSGSTGIGMRFSADNGSSVASSGYRTLNRRFNEGGHTDYSINGSTISEMRITEMNGVYHGMSTGEGIDMQIEVYDPLASRQTRMNYRGASIADRNTGYGDESLTNWVGASCESEPSAVNFIRFLPRSGTFESGTIKLYGIKA